jgi:hypothetical protein
MKTCLVRPAELPQIREDSLPDGAREYVVISVLAGAESVDVIEDVRHRAGIYGTQASGVRRPSNFSIAPMRDSTTIVDTDQKPVL